MTDKSSNTNSENEYQTLLNKLKILNLNKRPQILGKSPSRSTSKTRQEPSSREKRNTNLKTVSNQQHHSNQQQMASTPRGQAINNTEIINVLTFIQQKIETLRAYNEQLKTKLDINLTHQETL